MEETCFCCLSLSCLLLLRTIGEGRDSNKPGSFVDPSVPGKDMRQVSSGLGVEPATATSRTQAHLGHSSHGLARGHWLRAALTVLMDNRRRLKDIFICVLVGVTVVIIYLTSGYKPDHLYGPANKKSNATASSLPEPKWEDPGPYHVAYPRKYRFVMDNSPTCKTATPFLILMVPVAPANLEGRDTIRRTWGGKKMVLGRLVETVFIVGLPGGVDANQQQARLKQESERYRDLIQSNFQDSYRNLTIKTMVMLEWLAQHCAKASFMIKIDSDMLLHVDNLVALLLDPETPKENYMSGLVWWHSPVSRNPFNKFYMPSHVIAEPVYPPYPLGMAYVMSLDLPKKILSVSPHIKPIYIEDAYLGLCLNRLGVSPTNPPDQRMFQVIPRHPLSRCNLSKVIATTTTSMSQMQIYWQRIVQGVHC
ncbi:beta-1,3-galactosyltransferase 1-like isoform X2 [Xiphophorus maculatus]|uniref:beta-1,3-galactosyltransferase 1-like isoform X2 n=1 Tax=Xiphophorus maculatus TaxID=8083 RepID=UPI000C6E4C7B|nr:beta-1,3-galactosyltransferase 1-like isoform X2 [Xiphophorus maculatus]